MKYGSETPMAEAPMISRNPYPYPKVIPATHIEGEEGRNIVGNNATEANTRSPNTGLVNVFVSQFMIGIISCKRCITIKVFCNRRCSIRD